MNRANLCIAVSNFIYRDLLNNGLGNAETIGNKLVTELERLDVLKCNGKTTEESSDPSILPDPV